jgi:Chemotaxis phosphatase CheX
MKEKLQLPLAAKPWLADDLVDASREALSLVDGLVMDVTRALFETYGVKLDLDGCPIATTLPLVQLISTIGFSSSAISGSLLLAIPNVVIERTLPTGDANLADWVGELANQLLGRLKNQLLHYEVAINLALPVVVSGDEFSLPAKNRRLTRHYSFVSVWGRMFVRTEMELASSLELVRLTGGTNASIDEGELLFL